MGMMKLWPARMESKPLKIVADFDALISEPTGFIFQGKQYEIHAVDTESFMRVAKALSEVQELLGQRGEGKTVSEDDVYQGYLKFIQPLCPKIGMKEIRSMKLQQLDGLVNLIIRHLRGDVNSAPSTGDEDSPQKKNPKL